MPPNRQQQQQLDDSPKVERQLPRQHQQQHGDTLQAVGDNQNGEGEYVSFGGYPDEPQVQDIFESANPQARQEEVYQREDIEEEAPRRNLLDSEQARVYGRREVSPSFEQIEDATQQRGDHYSFSKDTMAHQVEE